MSVGDDMSSGLDDHDLHDDDHSGLDDTLTVDPDGAFHDDLAPDGAEPDDTGPDDHLVPDVVGTPDVDSAHDAGAVWHEQERDNTCAVAAQEFVLDAFTGVDHSEAELREVAESHGWYDPLGGTSIDDVGKILDHYGIDTERHDGASLADLESALADGDGVIVGVDSGEIWNPDTAPDDALTDYLGIPGQGADHAVQVVGVDHTDPAHPEVILNDSGTPDGQGERVPLATFLDAWDDSGNFMVVAHRP